MYPPRWRCASRRREEAEGCAEAAASKGSHRASERPLEELRLLIEDEGDLLAAAAKAWSEIQGGDPDSSSAPSDGRGSETEGV